MQDTVLVVPQYPYCIEEDRHDVHLEDCWAAMPQLFFSCLPPAPIKGPMEDAGAVKLYEPSPTPCLYVALAANMVGSNTTPTIPHKHSKNKNSCFPTGCADAAAEDGRRGSNVYEVNTWLWQFGRGKPRLGGLTIEETSDRQDSARKASDKCRKETREGSKGDGA